MTDVVQQQAVGRLGPAFARLWAATAASNLGDGLALVLLPLVVVQIDHSPAAVATVTVLTTAAWPLLGLPAGWVVDHLDRRRLVVAVNATRAAVLVTLAAAAWSDALTLPLVYAAALVLGAGETVADTALTSLVPMLVPPGRRGTANARLETTINLLNQLAGPPLAGLLLGLGASMATGSTAALYAGAAVGLMTLPRRSYVAATAKVTRAGDWRREVARGLVTIWGDRQLRHLTLVTAAMNVTWAAWTALFVLYAVEPGPLGLGPTQYGVLLTAMALGGLLVAPAVDPLTRRLGVRAVLLLDLLGTVLLAAPAALGLGWLPVAAGVVAAGSGATVWRTVVATIRQNRVEDHLMGRVYAASRFISWGVLPIGAAAAGALAESTSTRAGLAAAAILAVVVLAAFPFTTRGEDLDASYRG